MLKKIIANTVTIIISTSITFIACEFLVRWVLPQQLIVVDEGIWESDSLFSWKLKSNIRKSVNTGEQAVMVYTNPESIRVNAADTLEQTPPDIRILALGDSFMEALQVENEHTVNENLRIVLAEKWKKNVVVENHGVSGYAPNHYYLRAQHALKQKKYDLGIVYIFSGNDMISVFDTTLTPRGTSNAKAFDPIKAFTDKGTVKENILYPINNYCEQHMHLYVLLKQRSKTLLSKWGLTASYFPETMLKKNATAPFWSVTADVCKSIQYLFEQHHTPVLFVYIPASYQMDESKIQDQIRNFKMNPEMVDATQPLVRFAAVMKQVGVPYIDVYPYFYEKSQNGMSLYGSIDSHFNKNGHQLLSDYIYPAVDSLLTFNHQLR